jgi:hypothetical protein
VRVSALLLGAAALSRHAPLHCQGVCLSLVKCEGVCCVAGVRCSQLANMGSLVAGQEFQHILRLLNTNVDGRNNIMYALTAIKGIGRRFANVVCKKAEVDLRKRAGQWSGLGLAAAHAIGDVDFVFVGAAACLTHPFAAEPEFGCGRASCNR